MAFINTIIAALSFLHNIIRTLNHIHNHLPQLPPSLSLIYDAISHPFDGLNSLNRTATTQHQLPVVLQNNQQRVDDVPQTVLNLEIFIANNPTILNQVTPRRCSCARDQAIRDQRNNSGGSDVVIEMGEDHKGGVNEDGGMAPSFRDVADEDVSDGDLERFEERRQHTRDVALWEGWEVEWTGGVMYCVHFVLFALLLLVVLAVLN